MVSHHSHHGTCDTQNRVYVMHNMVSTAKVMVTSPHHDDMLFKSDYHSWACMYSFHLLPSFCLFVCQCVVWCMIVTLTWGHFAKTWVPRSTTSIQPTFHKNKSRPTKYVGILLLHTGEEVLHAPAPTVQIWARNFTIPYPQTTFI